MRAAARAAAVAALAGAVAVAGACGGGSRPAAKSAAAAAGERPSTERCREVVARLGTILPQHFPDAEQDFADCLGMPPPVVECLAEVKVEADLEGCVAAFCKERPDACPRVDAAWTPRPTRAECEKAFDHVMALRGATGAVGEEDRASFVGDCHAEAHKRDVDCVIGADDLTEVGQCGGR